MTKPDGTPDDPWLAEVDRSSAVERYVLRYHGRQVAVVWDVRDVNWLTEELNKVVKRKGGPDLIDD